MPIAPVRGRALDLSVNRKSILHGANWWAGELVIVDVSEIDDPKGLPFGDGAFDIVVLHRTLDALSAVARRQGREFAIRDFLSQAARILTPGGLVVGCVENRYGLDRMVGAAARLIGRTAAAVSAVRPLSVLACNRALALAGFEEIRLFSVLPGPDAPTRLQSIEPGWSRAACNRQVDALRPPLVRPSIYLIWRVLAQLGVSQYMGAATFFWGRKPC